MQKKPVTVTSWFPSSDTIAGFESIRTNVTFVSDLKIWFKRRAALSIAMSVARDNPPDIVYGFEVVGTVPAEKLASIYRVPLVAKYMGTIVFPFINKAELDKVKPYVEGLGVNADLFFMLNDGTKGDKVLSHLGVPQEKIRFRVDGVDKSRFVSLPDRTQACRSLGIDVNDDSFVCLCLSNHNSGYKRLDRAVRAVKEVSKSCSRIRLLLVGNGINTPFLKALSSDLGCDTFVTFLPKVSHADIPAILSIADVYLNTNDQSNLSHPVLEAMIAGKAVVSMDDGSLDGIIEDGVTGLLVSPNKSSTELPRALLKLANNYSLQNSLADNAKAYAVSSFMTWDEKNQLEVEEVKQLLK